MKSVKLIIIGIFVLTCFGTSLAQVGYNPLSVRPVLEDDIMYRKRVERRINLKEKQNLPFFAQDKWITQVILDGVNSGELTPYNYQTPSVDSLVPKWVLTQEMWQNKLADSSTRLAIGGGEGKRISVLEITEEYIFDKRRSRMYIDILSVKLLVLPQTPTEELDILAIFKFKDLHDYFRKVYARTNQMQAYWFNPKNDRRKLCFSDALDLRLFSSRITKISNPLDDAIGDEVTGEYSGKLKTLYRSQEIEYELMEYR